MIASNWLELASYCKRFNILPRTGGMLNQNPNEMKVIGGMMKILDDYEAEETERERAKR